MSQALKRPDPALPPISDPNLHQIVVVGGGAGGLELVTQLGKKLGRKGKAGVTLVDVPYKGAAPASVDLLGGRIDMAFLNVPGVLPQVKSGQLRALAVANVTRAKALPDTPTMAEDGYPGVAMSTWYGISAPAKTPQRPSSLPIPARKRRKLLFR